MYMCVCVCVCECLTYLAETKRDYIEILVL